MFKCYTIKLYSETQRQVLKRKNMKIIQIILTIAIMLNGTAADTLALRSISTANSPRKIPPEVEKTLSLAEVKKVIDPLVKELDKMLHGPDVRSRSEELVAKRIEINDKLTEISKGWAREQRFQDILQLLEYATADMFGGNYAACPHYDAVAITLLEEAKKEADHDKKEGFLRQSKEIAKIAIDKFKNRGTMQKHKYVPQSYDTITKVCKELGNYEEMIQWAHEALRCVDADIAWRVFWVIKLNDAYKMLPGTEEKRRLLFETIIAQFPKENFQRICFVYPLVELYASMFFHEPETMRKAKAMAEEAIEILERMEGIDEEQRMNTISGLKVGLAMVYMTFGQKNDYAKAILCCDEALAIDPNYLVATAHRTEAVVKFGEYLLQDDEENGRALLDKVTEQYDTVIIANTVAGDTNAQDQDYGRRYYKAHIEYIKGNYAEIEGEYRELIENAPHVLAMRLFYDYIDILHRLDKPEEARRAILKFFYHMKEADLVALPKGQIVFLQAFYYETAQRETVLTLSKDMLFEVESWTDIEPQDLQYMVKFILTYGKEDVEQICSRMLDLVTKQALGIEQAPHLEAILATLLKKDSTYTRRYIWYMLNASKHPALKEELSDYLKTKAIQPQFAAYELMSFSWLLQYCDYCPELIGFLCEKWHDTLDAYLTELNNDPRVIFPLLEASRMNTVFFSDDGSTYVTPHAILEAINVIGMRQRLFLHYPEEGKIYVKMLKEVLGELQEKYKFLLKASESLSKDTRLNLYCDLQTIAHSADVYTLAEEFAMKALAMTDGYESLLRSSPNGLRVLGGHATILERTGKHDTAAYLFRQWAEAINRYFDTVDRDEPLPDDISVPHLCFIVDTSVSLIERDILYKAAMNNPNILKACARATEAWLNTEESEKNVTITLHYAFLAYFLLKDMELFKGLMEKANMQLPQFDPDSPWTIVWGGSLNLNLAHLYAGEGKGQSSEAAHSIAKIMTDWASVIAIETKWELLIPHAIEFVYKEDYEEAIRILESGIEDLPQMTDKEDGAFCLRLLLAIAYQLKGEVVRADELIDQALSDEARRWQAALPEERDELIRKGAHQYAPNFYMLVPEFCQIAVGFFRNRIFNNQLPSESREIALNILELIGWNETLPLLMQHIRDIISGKAAFDETRDIGIIKRIAALPLDQGLIIADLCLILSNSKALSGYRNAKELLRNIHRRLLKGEASEESVIAVVEYLYDNGRYNQSRYSEALQLIERTIGTMTASSPNADMSRLEAVRDKIKGVIEIVKSIKGEYRGNRFQSASAACNELLAINADNSLAVDIKSTCETILQGREYLLAGRVAEAHKALADLPKQDNKVRGLIKDLDLLITRLDRAKGNLAQNRYQAADKELSKVYAQPVLGVNITDDTPGVKELADGISKCREDVAFFLGVLKNDVSISELYESAQLLLEFPEHTGDVFETLLTSAVKVFNSTASCANTEEAKMAYRRAFNIARLVYELKDYASEARYLKKAQQIISHAAANIWMPELADDYFIIKAKLMAEKSKRERFYRAETDSTRDVPIEFDFRNIRIMEEELGFVLEGFRTEHIRDMREYVFYGDSFMVKTADGDILPGYFSVTSARKNSLVFRLSRKKEGDTQDMIKTLQEKLENGGRIISSMDIAWQLKRDMLKDILIAMRGSVKTNLDAGSENYQLATAGSRQLDNILGLLLDIPTAQDEIRHKAQNAAKSGLTEAKEIQEGLLFDDSQREAITSSLNTDKPFTLIQGPAGTGKTSVIVWITEILAKLGMPENGGAVSVKIMSQTHPGIDNVGEKLLRWEKDDAGRLVPLEEGDEPSHPVVLARVGNVGDSVRGEMYLIWEEKTKRLSLIANSKGKNILLGTINGIFLDGDLRKKFTSLLDTEFVIVDESSRATVPESLWAVRVFGNIRKVIFVGDHYQLPAYGLDRTQIEAILKELKGGEVQGYADPLRPLANRALRDVFKKYRVRAFKISLLERLLDLYGCDKGKEDYDPETDKIFTVTRPEFYFLDMQRRSGTRIVKLESYFYDFYDQRLTAGRSYPGVVIEDDYKGEYRDRRLVGKKADTDEDSPDAGIVNEGEIGRVIHWVNRLINERGMAAKNMAVISPYSKQVEWIHDALVDFAYIHEYLVGIENGVGFDRFFIHRVKEIWKRSNFVKIWIEEIKRQHVLKREKLDREGFKVLANNLMNNPDAKKARRLREMLGLGERFISRSDMQKEIFTVSTIDSAIGSEWKAVILSWVRSNDRGRVGFLADEDQEGKKRRCVGMTRPQNILINIWDRATFINADDRNHSKEVKEVRRWAQFCVEVFEEARHDHGDDVTAYLHPDGVDLRYQVHQSINAAALRPQAVAFDRHLIDIMQANFEFLTEGLLFLSDSSDVSLRPAASAQARITELSQAIGLKSSSAGGAEGEAGSDTEDPDKTKDMLPRSFASAKALLALEPAKEYQVKAALNKLKADFGFLPQDTDILRYIKRLMKEKIYPDLDEEYLPRIEVLASKGFGVNAMVYANNTIVVTPELLDFIEREEELLFVLCHEMVHLDKEHFTKMHDVIRRESIRQMFGLARYQEYQADLIAVSMLDERNINVHGAIRLNQRLRNKGFNWGPVHGSSTDRLLNIETLTYMKDIQALSYLLTELPDGFSAEVHKILDVRGKRIEQITFDGRAVQSEDDEDNDKGKRPYDYRKRLKIAQHANIYLIQQSVPQLCRQVSSDEKLLAQAGKDEGDFTSVIAVRLSENRKILSILVNRAEELIELPGEDVMPSTKFMLMQLMVGGRQLAMRKEFPADIKKDFKAVLQSLNTWVFKKDIPAKLGLTIDAYLLGELIGDIFESALDNLVYEPDGEFDFARYLSDAEQVISSAKEYAENRGLGHFDSRMLWSEVVYLGIHMFFDLGCEDNIPSYLDEVNKYADVIELFPVGFLELAEGDDIVEMDTLIPLLREAGFTELANAGKGSFEQGSLTYRLVTGIDKHEKILEDDISKCTLTEIIKSLDEIRSSVPDTAYDIFESIIGLIDEGLEDNLTGEGILEGPTIKDRMISYIQFILLFHNERGTYRKGVKSFFRDIPCEFNLKDIGKELSYSDLEEIASAIRDIQVAEERFNVKATLSDADVIKAEDLSQFRELLFWILQRRLKATDNKNDFFSELDSFLNRWPLARLADFSTAWYSKELEAYGYLFGLDGIVKQGISYIGSDAISPDENDPERLKQLFMLSFFSRDLFVRNTIQEYVLPILLRNLSFDEALSFVEDAYTPQQRIGFMSGWEYLIETKADSTKHMDILTNRVHRAFVIDEAGSFERAGDLIGIEAYMEMLFKKPRELLSMLLDTSRDDTRLKNFLFTIWWYIHKDRLKPSGVIFLEENRLDDWALENPFETAEASLLGEHYFALEDMLNFFYRMDYKARYMLLRKLLTGNRGVLTTQIGRDALLDQFMDGFVSFESNEGPMREIIEQVLRGFVEVAQDDQLYFALYPLLIDRIATPPAEAAPWEKIRAFRSVVAGVLGTDEDNPDFISPEEAQAMEEFGLIPSEPQGNSTLIPYLEKRILMWIYGYNREKSLQQETADTLLMSTMPGEAYSRDESKLTGIALILELAKRLGTPGVRFLQLLGQFIDLPPEYSKEFMMVYDSMIGQSRLSAYQTLKRECPEYVKQIKRFGKRIGGGSLMTVYEVELIDGTREALKIRNPNAEYFTEQSLKLLTEVLTELAAEDSRYRQALPLLDDLCEWIYLDLHDETFIEDDREFARQNKGYKQKGFKLEPFVPKSKDSGSLLVLRDELVEGYNFTDFKRVQDCVPGQEATQKEAVSLIARNYFDQMFLGGFSSKAKGIAMLVSKRRSIVHSDIHPGNFKVLDGKKVAVLDRSSFIKLDRDDRGLLYNISKAETIKKRLQIFIDYLSGQPGNEGLRDKSEAERIISAVLEDLAEQGDGLENVIMDIIIRLKNHGIKTPLKIARLIKNLNGLKRLAEQVGFSSLQQALEYKPKDTAKASSAGSAEDNEAKLELAGKYITNAKASYEAGAYNEANRFLSKALRIYAESGDLYREAVGWKFIGNNYFRLKLYEDSAQNHKRSASLFEELGNRRFVGPVKWRSMRIEAAKAWSSAAQAYSMITKLNEEARAKLSASDEAARTELLASDQAAWDNAVRCLKNCLRFNKELGLTDMASKTRTVLGNTYVQAGRFLEAAEQYEMSAKMDEASGNIRSAVKGWSQAAAAYVKKAETHGDLRDYADAARCDNRSAELNERLGQCPLAIRHYLYAALSYGKVGMHNAADGCNARAREITGIVGRNMIKGMSGVPSMEDLRRCFMIQHSYVPDDVRQLLEETFDMVWLMVELDRPDRADVEKAEAAMVQKAIASAA